MNVRTRRGLETAALLAVAAIFAYAAWVGLVWAPPDREMGDVQRIMYAHVPMVQMMLLAGTINFVCCVLYLFRASWKTDALAEASAEITLVFGAIGTTLGSIWGRPTWGVYWAWDPRLTTVAILLVAYAGYMALRRFVDDPERRAVWAAVTGIVIAVDVPIIYSSPRHAPSIRRWSTPFAGTSSPSSSCSSSSWWSATGSPSRPACERPPCRRRRRGDGRRWRHEHPRHRARRGRRGPHPGRLGIREDGLRDLLDRPVPLCAVALDPEPTVGGEEVTSATRNRLFALGALAIAGAGLAFVAFGNIGKNLVFYWTPGEMLAQGSKAYGPTIRLGGIVQPGSLRWDANHTHLTFRVADSDKPGAASVLVDSRETPPQMFRERIGVVVEGTFDKSQTFTSSRLMVNHSNEYRPPKPGEQDRWKTTVSAPTAEAR